MLIYPIRGVPNSVPIRRTARTRTAGISPCSSFEMLRGTCTRVAFISSKLTSYSTPDPTPIAIQTVLDASGQPKRKHSNVKIWIAVDCNVKLASAILGLFCTHRRHCVCAWGSKNQLHLL